MRENILIKTNTLGQVLQWKYDGLKLKEIAEKLKNEFNVNVSVQQISHILVNIKTQKDIEQKEKTAQDVLYENRIEVIKMKKERYIYSAIAKRFGVKETDVIEFLSKRKRLTPEQHREILYKYSQGATAQEIADEFGVNVRSIESILSKQKVLTTSTRVMARVNQNKGKEGDNDLFDPDICKEFIKFINTIQSRYEYCKEDIQKFDNVRNDIYHRLEMCDIGQEEQLSLLNQIKESSVERRQLKDFMEKAQPIIDFMSDEDNKRVLQSFANIVGMVVNNIKKMDTRVYFLREEEK